MNRLQTDQNLDSHYGRDNYETRFQNYQQQFAAHNDIRSHLINSHVRDTRIYRTRRGNMYATTARRRNDNSMTIRQVDDTGLPAEDRTEVRMNIEDVSYEELLELGEQIGNVNNSLSEEIIINQLKTKIYLLPVNSASLEETNPCVICQEEFKDKEEIGILGCGHQYHSDCLKKWLLVKNVCPMCKSEGIHLE